MRRRYEPIEGSANTPAALVNLLQRHWDEAGAHPPGIGGGAGPAAPGPAGADGAGAGPPPGAPAPEPRPPAVPRPVPAAGPAAGGPEVVEVPNVEEQLEEQDQGWIDYFVDTLNSPG